MFMHSTDPEYKINNVSNTAIEKATGKTWPEWFVFLDKAEMHKQPHKQIAEYVYEHLKKGWWSQMVAVGYEQARGLRNVHERPDGYECSVSKTINAPLSKLYDAWADETKRHAWLLEKLEVTSKTENKYFNARWKDNKTRIVVGFYAKGEAKSQVAVAHTKLASAQDVEAMKKFWHEKLDLLAERLER